MVQPGTPVPPSRQLAALIRRQIKTGELVQGDRIPSRADLAERHQVALVTATKAVKILINEGLVYTVPGFGTFVGPPGPEDA
jgi:DNA-binding GntR family transcriptional regulator